MIRSTDSVRPQHHSDPGWSRVVSRLLAGPRDGCNRISLRRVDVQPGGHTPRDTSPSERVFLVLSGRGECVDPDGFASEIGPGDTVIVLPWELFHLQNRTAQDLVLLMASGPGK